MYDTDCLSLFGTTSFNLVWESVCSEIMDNQLEARLGTIRLPTSLLAKYDRSSKLIDLIEKPFWTRTGMSASDTLIPDLVSIAQVDGIWQFIIFDAKYYTARLDYGLPPKGQPGIESITKQYLYQLAFQRFITDHGFSDIRNCFLLPSESDKIEDRGTVVLNMLKNLGLQSIQVRLLPARLAFDLYIAGKKLDLKSLAL